MTWIAFFFGMIIGLASALFLIGLCLGSAIEYPEVEHDTEIH